MAPPESPRSFALFGAGLVGALLLYAGLSMHSGRHVPRDDHHMASSFLRARSSPLRPLGFVASVIDELPSQPLSLALMTSQSQPPSSTTEPSLPALQGDLLVVSIGHTTYMCVGPQFQPDTTGPSALLVHVGPSIAHGEHRYESSSARGHALH
jgi:hypothetical protein